MRTRLRFLPHVMAALVVVVAGSCRRPPEAVGVDARPTRLSASRATFDTNVALVSGSQIPTEKPLVMTVTLGRGLAAGSQISVAFPTAVQEETDALWSIPTMDPGQPGSVRAMGPVEVLAAGRIEGGAGRVVLGLTSDVQAGEKVSLALSGQVPEIVPLRPFRVWEVDRADGSIAELPPENVAIPPVVAAPAVTVRLVAAGDGVVGTPFDLRMVALDPYGNVDAGYRGHVELTSDLAGCPTDYVFVESDRGIHVVNGLVARQPGIHRVSGRAAVRGADLAISSSPVLIAASTPAYRHLFGDPHFHTGSDVENLTTPGGDHRGQFVTAEDAFHYLRDVAGLDWGASAEHDTGLSSETWLADQRTVDALDQPGRFATLDAYEFTPPRRLGHHVVLFEGGADAGNPLVRASSGKRRGEGAANFVELIDALESRVGQGERFLVIPHVMQPYPNGDPDKDDRDQPHEIWDGPPGAAPRNVRNEARRVGEIYSHHNDDFSAGDFRQTERGRGDAVNQPQLFELGAANPWSYQHAWTTGHRIGLIGGSDNHLGTPGQNDYAPTVQQHAGLAVVLATDVTRKAVFDALWNRRCYATTGPRILLDFTVDGEQMGSELSRPPGARLTIAARVAGTAPLASVELVKLVDGAFATVDRATVVPDGLDASLAFDDAFEASTLYYVRVTQSDGEMAWSSPVWIDPPVGR